MAKSLGQIHTADFSYSGPLASGDRILVDTASILTSQLQHMVRQGNYMKMVGIDMNLTESGATGGGVSLSGEFRYYSPTRGRCDAFKSAYHAVRRGMKLQGINVSGNRQYDFRAPLANLDLYVNGGDFLNAATIDGINELALYAIVDDEGIFNVWNQNIEPSQDNVPNFSSGFGLPSHTGTPTDYVLQQGEMYEGSMVPHAHTALETIPFQIIWEPGSGDNFATSTFQFRPDPALYVALLTGQVEIYIDEIEYHDEATDARIDLSVYIAGWKSIMGNPDKKRRSRRSSKKTTSKKTTRGRKK